jgi:AbiU2
MTGSFENELEVFRTEEETAQQYFFAYLSVRSLAASDENVLQNMNSTPLFWRTTHHAMLLTAFVALGRIFDQDPKSDHNIDKLMRVTGDSLHLYGGCDRASPSSHPGRPKNPTRGGISSESFSICSDVSRRLIR